MDPSEKNQYHTFYTRTKSFTSFRFVGLLVVTLLFAAIPVVVLTVNHQTNSGSHAAIPEISPILTISLAPINQLSTFPIPQVPCIIRPACLDATPACALPEPSNGWCPIASPPANTTNASITIVSPIISVNTGNAHPLHPTKSLTLTLYNIATGKIYTAMDSIVFDGKNSFTNPHISLGNIPSGVYEILVNIPGYLQKSLTQVTNSHSFSLQAGTTLVIPPITVVPGDIAPIPNNNNQLYGDNVLDISDYNQLLGCYSEQQAAKACSNAENLATDLNDDGKIDAIDYNILLRSFAIRNGDTIGITNDATPTQAQAPAITEEPTNIVIPTTSTTPTITTEPTPTLP